jgi:hypothetical protein
MEKENNIGKNIKRTMAGVLVGINMMVPGAGTAGSEEPTPEEIKSPAGVSDVLKEETKTGELEKLEELGKIEEMEKLEEMEVNQRFSEFLNGEGEYSDENLKLKLWRHYDKTADLGFSKAILKDFFAFQSVLLFHKYVDGEEIMALGLKNRKGKRIITAVTMPIKDILKTGILIQIGFLAQNYSNSNVKPYSDESEISSILDDGVGSLVNFYMNHSPDGFLGSYDDGFEKTYLSVFSNKGDINRNFLKGIWRPKVNDVKISSTKEIFERYQGDGVVLSVNNYSDFMGLINQSESLPFVLNTYFPYK